MWPHLLSLALAPPLRRAPSPSLQGRPVTWSNPQGTDLTQIHEDVCERPTSPRTLGTDLTQAVLRTGLAERPFYPTLPGLQGTDVGCKACVVRLPSGELWVHAPVGLDEPLRAALERLGPVGHIVTPNTEHQKVLNEPLPAPTPGLTRNLTHGPSLRRRG